MSEEDLLREEVAQPAILKLGGKEYMLLWNYNSLIALQKQTGRRDLLTTKGWKALALQEDAESNLAIFWALLREYHKDVTFEQAGRLMTNRTATRIVEKCSEAMRNGYSQEDESPNPEAPAEEIAPTVGQ